MDGDSSPDYSAPRERRFTPPRNISPLYSNSPRRSPSRSPGPSRRRSRSPVRWKRERSFSPESRWTASDWESLSWEEQETIQTLHCRNCEVTLHDRDSMMAHIKGRKHLAQLKRLQDKEMRERTGGRLGLSDLLRPNREIYDEKYWDRERGNRRLRPEQERYLDSKRLDSMKAKFEPETYDHGQYKYNKEELYCSDCDVWVRSRDQMQAHKEGANHRKKSARVKVYECKLCLIQVPCQDTLNNHMRGKDHIKRVNQLQESRRQRGEVSGEADEPGYRTGPLEMARLKDDEREELGRLRLENEILKKKVQQYKEEREKCVREHGTTEVAELRRLVKECREKHLRQGLLGFKREVKEEHQPSTSHVRRVKVEHRVKTEEYWEHDVVDIDLTEFD